MKQIKEKLAHVFWIGGSPCSGKSSISELLSQRFGCQVYHCDKAFDAHVNQIVPDRHPNFHKVTQMSWDEIWMRPLDLLIADAIQVYREECEMILDDLLALPRSSPILAEGTALLPDCVTSVLSDRHRAFWMVPTEQFQREQYTQRGPWVQEILRQCADPEAAFGNWMDRDIAFGRWVIDRTEELNLKHLVIDGGSSISEYAAIVQEHFQLS